MKKKVGLIGKGKWGSLIKSKLSTIANLEFVFGQNKNLYNLVKKKNLDWIFIATPNSTHYKIVKKCLNLKVNVFCEKPLTTNLNKAKNLFQIAKKNKVKLYVSDVYSFHKKKISKVLIHNKIERSKNVIGKDNEFLNRFMYHDISLLYKHIKNKKIGSIQLNQNKKKKLFCINIKFKDSTNFTFDYHLKSRIKKHLINDTNFITKDDALKKMINSVLYKKINLRLNNSKALFILNFLDFLRNKL